MSDGIPAEGLTLAAFGVQVAPFVAPEDLPGIVRRLHQRKVVWLSKNRGAVMVYGSRPAKPAVPLAVAIGPLDRFVSAVAPHVLRVLNSVDQYEEDVACGRAIGVVRRHAQNCHLEEMRRVLWHLFPEKAVKRIAWHEPRLQRDATEATLAAVVKAHQRLPRGMGVEDRIVALIGKAVAKGATANGVMKMLNPRPTREEINAVLLDLEAEGRIARLSPVGGRGRPTTRWVVI